MNRANKLGNRQDFEQMQMKKGTKPRMLHVKNPPGTKLFRKAQARVLGLPGKMYSGGTWNSYVAVEKRRQKDAEEKERKILSAASALQPNVLAQ